MWRPVLLFGVLGGVLVVLLRWIEYRWLVLAHAFEIYGALVAVLFAAVGLWLGARFARRRVPAPAAPPSPPPAVGFVRDEAQVREAGLTPRELQILDLIAEGLSNREIGSRLFVSENTVKTHATRIFDKLGARRRTQAVQQARRRRLVA